MISADNLFKTALFAGIISLKACFAANSPISEITSNEMFGCDGNGDTVWVLTARGVNYTTHALDAVSGSISWQGYFSKPIEYNGALSISYGAGQCFVPVNKSDTQSVNDILIFSDAGEPSSVRLPFQYSIFEDTVNTRIADFTVSDIRWCADYFWMAATEGGLVRYSASEQMIFYPGRKAGYTFQTFVKDSFPFITSAPDSAIVAIDAHRQSRKVWVARPHELWSFSTDSLAWSFCGSVGTDSITGITVLNPHRILVSTEIPSADSSSHLYNFTESGSGIWSVSQVSARNTPDLVCMLDSGHIYMVDDNIVEHWEFADSSLLIKTDFEKGRDLPAMQTDIDVRSPVIFDIFYSMKQNTGLLWVATNEGLMLSYSSAFDFRALDTLMIFRKDLEAGKGLKNRNVYAFPGILNDNYRNQQAVFAYNLEKDDYVTIDIFDWNMDPVVCVVKSEFRNAGSTRSDGSGFSTVRSRDYWDGTFGNNNGKTVAPGVYYFRIRAASGGQAVGKIVVAKPDY